MILPNPKDAIHKAWMFRILSGFYDDAEISNSLYFKGGTCATMLGYLDRFSVDLDFDFMGDRKEEIINQDLNFLLPYDKFRKIREVIKNEVLTLIRDEFKRLKN